MAMGYSLTQVAAAEQDREPSTRIVMDGDMGSMTKLAPEQQKGETSLVNAGAVVDGLLKVEQNGAQKMDGLEASSRPPSPPESGTTTPHLRIAPCPPRLRPFYPPPNYGCVQYSTLYRSSYPQDRHMDFVKSLRIRSIITLVATEPTDGYQQWMKAHKIKRTTVNIAPNKDSKISTTIESLCEALLFVMDSSNFPVYIHCNQGRHRTGCVIACLRKIQHWPIDKIIEEYVTYSWPKARDGDIALIKSFNPNVLFEYAMTHGSVTGSKSQGWRLDSSITDIDSLVAALGSGALSDGFASPDWDWSTLSTTSSESSDGPIEMCISGPNADGKPQEPDSSGTKRAISDMQSRPATNATDERLVEVERDIQMKDGESVGTKRVVIMDGSNGTEGSITPKLEEQA